MDRFKFISKDKIEQLPKTSGVYSLASPKPNGEGGFEIIYIGKATSIRNRVKNHFSQPSYRDDLFINNVDKIGFFETNSEIEALVLEANLIKKYQPKYNVMWRDDKNYFYVAVAKNKDKIPYVYITHQPQKSEIRISKSETNSKFETNSNFKFQISNFQYVGPFTEGVALKKTLRFLRRVFPYYTSAKHPKVKCAWCHLDLCPGPRLFEARLASPKGEAADLIAEYKKNIKKLILILKGKRKAVLSSLKKEMSRYARSGITRKHDLENRDFEKAGKIRDRIYNLQQVMAHTHVISNEKKVVGFFAGAKNPTSIPPLQILQKILDLEKISRIECYDVSNIQGKNATGSMVVFSARGGSAFGWVPDKSQYKKFHIHIEGKPNDIAMLKEVLERRFKHTEWKYPDAILIDGGKAQLNVAIETKNQRSKAKNIKILSIAKRNNKLFIEGRNKPILLKTLPREIFNLILQLRDEAHRFAITYHKKLRKKNLLP